MFDHLPVVGAGHGTGAADAMVSSPNTTKMTQLNPAVGLRLSMGGTSMTPVKMLVAALLVPVLVILTLTVAIVVAFALL
jgi:hypothetical protein